ncbi:MAG: hypothetical protein QXT53_01055 [Ignisphaera sp.]
MKKLRIAVIQAIDYGKCREVVDKLKSGHFDLIMLCGGVGQCLDVLKIDKSVYGIVDVDDDIYIVKALKDAGAYVAGSLRFIDEGICISGIDAKNPIQNIERLKEKLSPNCFLTLLLSHYSLKTSSCSRIKLLGKDLNIGIKNIFRDVNKPARLLFISCNRSYQSDMCIDILDPNTILVSTNKQFISLLIDVQDLGIVVLGE